MNSFKLKSIQLLFKGVSDFKTKPLTKEMLADIIDKYFKVNPWASVFHFDGPLWCLLIFMVLITLDTLIGNIAFIS